MNKFRAHISQDWMTNRARILLVDENYVWMGDGSLYHYTEAEQIPAEAGFEVPVAALAAIQEAFAEWQGKSNDAKTEAAVLREWLKVEKDRVDLLVIKAYER